MRLGGSHCLQGRGGQLRPDLRGSSTAKPAQASAARARPCPPLPPCRTDSAAAVIYLDGIYLDGIYLDGIYTVYIPRRYLPRRYIPRRYIYGIYTSTVYTSTVSYLDGRRHTQRCRSKLRGRDAAVGKPRSADRPTATRTALCSCGGWWQRAGERACRLRTAAVSAAPASCRALHRLQPAARPRRQPAQQQHGGRLAPAAGILQADCGYVSMSRRHGSELQSGRGCAAVSQPAVSLQLQQGFMVWWRRWRRCCCWW